jgi:hypothetical protein
MADADFSNNLYFKKNFPHIIPFYVIPFQVSERFVNKKSKSERSNKVLVGGTVHDLKNETQIEYYESFMSFFNSHSYHYIRDYFLNNHHELVDSKVYPFRINGSTYQKEYFKMNIVDLLNSYRFVCYDMELSGAPAITTLEAIACGCIPIVEKGSLLGLEMEGKFDYLEFNKDLGFLEFLNLDFMALENDQKNTDVSNHIDSIVEKNLSKIKAYFIH